MTTCGVLYSLFLQLFFGNMCIVVVIDSHIGIQVWQQSSWTESLRPNQMNCFAVCQGAFSRQLYFHLSIFFLQQVNLLISHLNINCISGLATVRFYLWPIHLRVINLRTRYNLVCAIILNKGTGEKGFFSKRFLKI